MIDENIAPLFDSAFLGKLERLALIARRRARGEERADRRSHRTGASLEFADHRSYVRGDDLRSIDWNIYGRMERLFVKLYEQEEALPVAILIDASASMRWETGGGGRGGRAAKFDLARRLAAALAYVGLAHLDRVEVAFFAETLEQGVVLGRGKKHFHRVLDYLEGKGGGREGTTDFDGCFKRFQARSRRRGLVCVLSDFLAPGGWEAAMRRLDTAHFDLVLIQVVDAAERDPGLRGDLRLLDSESGVELDVTVDRAVLAAYRRAFEAHGEALSRFCLERGHGWLQADTGVAFDDLALLFLREGGLVR